MHPIHGGNGTMIWSGGSGTMIWCLATLVCGFLFAWKRPRVLAWVGICQRAPHGSTTVRRRCLAQSIVKTLHDLSPLFSCMCRRYIFHDCPRLRSSCVFLHVTLARLKMVSFLEISAVARTPSFFGLHRIQAVWRQRRIQIQAGNLLGFFLCYWYL
jgi:hypothetical protein